MRTQRDRWLMAGAIWGPGLFIIAWMVGGFLVVGYSPLENHISDLAAVNAPTRVLMTVGLAAFGFGVGTFQTAGSQPTQPDSIGLGLSISRQLARAMGGDLTYRYSEGKSVFSLTLPTSRLALTERTPHTAESSLS